MVLRRHLRPGACAALLLAAPALAGCGGGGAVAPASAAGASGGSSGMRGAVAVSSTSLGRILVAGDGKTLYLFQKDGDGRSTCSGACAHFWPPYTAKGRLVAGAGAKTSLLARAMRPGGGTQLAYNGHPLYLFSGDAHAGQTAGQGLTDFGGAWYVLSPSGSAVRSSGASAGGRY
jgi:predicted lipoprotein with Yx(FWY)xxD motif